MKTTKIEWCDATLNPVVGCTKGCTYCYARRLNQRFQWTEDFSKPVFFPERLRQIPLKKSYRIFLNSMSDVADWSCNWAEQVLRAMSQAPQNQYLLLTKRPAEISFLRALAQENIWVGVTVNSDTVKPEGVERVMEEAPKTMNWFFSAEPLMGPLDISEAAKRGLKWLIIGAETGNRKGKVIPSLDWIRVLVQQADSYQIPVFMKGSLRGLVPEKEFREDFPPSLLP